MDSINPVSGTGTVPKQISPQTQKDTPQGKLPKQVKQVTSGATSLAKLKYSANTWQQRASIQADLQYGQAFAMCVRAIVEVACNHEYVQVQTAHTKSSATSSFGRKIHSDAATPVMTEPSTGDCLLDIAIKFSIDSWDIRKIKKTFDLGPNNERIADLKTLLYRMHIWLINIIEARKKEVLVKNEPSQAEIDANKKSEIDIIIEFFTTLDIFHKDKKQDKEFVHIVEGIASFVRVDKKEEESMSLFVKSFVAHCNEAKRRLKMKENREVISRIFRGFSKVLLLQHANLVSSFWLEFRLISELRKNNLDIIDSFRRKLIKSCDADLLTLS